MDPDLRLTELSRQASELDAEIRRLTELRREVAIEAGKITAAQVDAVPNAPTGEALDVGRLAAIIERKAQDLLESENLIPADGLFRNPRIMVGMTVVLVSDDGQRTTAVIHIDAHQFRGLVGVVGRARAHAAVDKEATVATDLVVDLMGEGIVDLARDAEAGEIAWWDDRRRNFPRTLDELRRELPASQTWIHPRIDDL